MNFLLSIFVIFGLCCCLVISNEDEKQEPVQVTVRLISDGVDRERRSADDPLPDHLRLSFDADGKEVKLRLDRIPNLKTTVMQDGEVFDHDMSTVNHAAVYTDRDLGASLIVRPISPGAYTLEGTLYLDSAYVQIKRSLREKREVGDDKTGVSHEITKTTIKKIDLEHDYVFPPDYKKPDGSRLDWYLKQNRRPKRATCTSAHTVEVYFVADFEDLNNFKEKYSNNTTLAKSEMVLFYTGIGVAIDIRYKSVEQQDPTFCISIQAAGLRIIEVATDAPWIRNHSKDGIVPAGDALDGFHTWALANLPTTDHYMTFTGTNLNGSTISTAGLAYVGAVCTSHSVSLVEASPSDPSTVTGVAAHEIGHSLNSVHDGVGVASSCDASRFNTMSSSLAQVPNAWIFSTCSVAQFKEYVERLSVNCTTTTTGSTLAPPGLQYGQLRDADAQCQLKEGTNLARIFYNITTYPGMCVGMSCLTPGSDFSASIVVVPHEYTSCGNKKWCFGGVCVADAAAPAVYDDCPQGDQPGKTCNVADCSTYADYQKTWCCNTCHAATTTAATTAEATTPLATTPAATTPEVTTPAATTPEATTPEATTPEVTTPAATTPEVTTPAATTPEVTTPAATTPKVTTPELTTPAATTPEVTTPAATTPKVTTHEVTTPAATTPKVTTPAATTPEVTTPAATTPEVTTPEVTTPEVTTPAATTPEATTPEVTTPAATTPEATTPEATTPAATTPAATTPEATTPAATTPEATTPEATTPEVTTSGATTHETTTRMASTGTTPVMSCPLLPRRKMKFPLGICLFSKKYLRICFKWEPKSKGIFIEYMRNGCCNCGLKPRRILVKWVCKWLKKRNLCKWSGKNVLIAYWKRKCCYRGWWWWG